MAFQLAESACTAPGEADMDRDGCRHLAQHALLLLQMLISVAMSIWNVAFTAMKWLACLGVNAVPGRGGSESRVGVSVCWW